jgi:hypothetical protein
MRLLTAILIAVCFVSCTEKEQAKAVPKQYDKAWVMSSGWNGFMGVAIALKGDKYFYWFYSDVMLPHEPEYPIIGTYKIDGETLILDDSQNRLYATRWKFTQNAQKTCLWSEKDIGDYPRMLILDPNFNPKDPFVNQPKLEVEQGGAAKPLPPSAPEAD